MQSTHDQSPGKAHSKYVVVIFSAHDFIICDQSAYRKGHLTDTALHKLITQLLVDENEGLLSGACFFDIQK